MGHPLLPLSPTPTPILPPLLLSLINNLYSVYLLRAYHCIAVIIRASRSAAIQPRSDRMMSG